MLKEGVGKVIISGCFIGILIIMFWLCSIMFRKLLGENGLCKRKYCYVDICLNVMFDILKWIGKSLKFVWYSMLW